jgi:hypothetical protein
VARANGGKAAKRLDEAFPDSGRAKGIAKEAREGREHRRVTEWLRGLAEEWDYAERVGMPDRRMPDVLFRTAGAPFDVFLAEAKDEERPTHKKSADQVRAYFETLIELREGGDVGEVLFGIGTGDDDVAQAWSDFLVELADENDIEVEPQRHEVTDEEDEEDREPLIFVYLEIAASSDDDEDDDDEDDEDDEDEEDDEKDSDAEER